MKTNPFYDTWLFLIGATGDQVALGAFRYVVVAVFIALIIASCWIAWTNWREDPAQRTAANTATWLSRLLVGCMWFQGCLWKLPLPHSGGFEYWVGQLGDNAAFAFHRALVQSVYLPYIDVIDPLVFLAELAFAVSLMLGIGVRLFSVLAALYTLHLWLGLYLNPEEWPWNYMFLALLHVLFAAHAAGRCLGFDALLRRRAGPGLVRKLEVAFG